MGSIPGNNLSMKVMIKMPSVILLLTWSADTVRLMFIKIWSKDYLNETHLGELRTQISGPNSRPIASASPWEALKYAEPYIYFWLLKVKIIYFLDFHSKHGFREIGRGLSKSSEPNSLWLFNSGGWYQSRLTVNGEEHKLGIQKVLLHKLNSEYLFSKWVY